MAWKKLKTKNKDEIVFVNGQNRVIVNDSPYGEGYDVITQMGRGESIESFHTKSAALDYAKRWMRQSIAWEKK